MLLFGFCLVCLNLNFIILWRFLFVIRCSYLYWHYSVLFLFCLKLLWLITYLLWLLAPLFWCSLCCYMLFIWYYCSILCALFDIVFCIIRFVIEVCPAFQIIFLCYIRVFGVWGVCFCLIPCSTLTCCFVYHICSLDVRSALYQLLCVVDFLSLCVLYCLPFVGVLCLVSIACGWLFFV